MSVRSVPTMASLEKLTKALEALKTLRNSNHAPEENYAKSKEKVILAISLADLLCAPETRATTNFTPHLSFAMESLFHLCDDPDSNVRMAADECLNRIIRTLMDGHVGKVNLELHVEIKRNRKARSLRAALVKFAELAHTIRPNKRKVYIQNLVPCILKIAQRKEESVQETLASSLSKILVTLGCFMTDNDVKDLLQVFLKNIESENAVFRRTAATSILAVCLNCHKSQLFIVHTINTLLETVIPIKEDQNVFTMLGVLNCIRGLFGHLDGKNTETGLRGSFGQKRKKNKEPVLAIDSLIQVFELCLHLTQHEDHNIVTAALETLNELLTTPPALLLPVLFNQQGLSRSRIHSSNVNWKLSTRTLSDISVATTIPISEDISLFESEDFSLHQEDLGTWFNDGSNNESQLNPLVLDKERPASVSTDTYQDYPDGDSVMSDELGSFMRSLPFQSSEPDIYLARESPSPPLNSIQPMNWDIGELTDGSQSPLLFTARRLVTRFLIPECGNSRVSVRSLALMCLSQVLRLQPSVFFEPLDKNGLSTPKGFSHICDLICFAEDSDQQLRGHCRLLIAHLIQSLFNQALFETHFEEKLDKVVSIEKLMDIMLTGIEDESSVCVRHSLMALLLCLPVIMESSYYVLVTPILNKLLAVTQNPYWLVKVHLIELFCSLPYQCVYFMTGNTVYQSKVFNILIGDFLSDEDNRVRKTACEGIMKIVKNLYFPVDYGTDDVVVARGVELVSMMFSDIFIRGGKKNLFGTVIEENTLSRVVDVLVETLMASSSKNQSYGCIEALCNLSEEYSPSLYPDSWQCRDNSTEKEPTSAGGVFSLVVTLLTNSYISHDLECHQWLLKLASNLFTGLLRHHLKQRDGQLPEKSRLMASIDELLIHLMRLMNIFVNVVEDNVQPRNFLSSPLKKRQPPRPNSPSKLPLLPEKESEKDEKVRVIGFYGNIPQCVKLYEIIRSGYTNYKLTLDRVASKKFLSLITHTLGCLEVMLSPNNIIDSEKMFEELLQYLRVSFILDSEATVKVVHELLRSLFEINLLGIATTNILESEPSRASLPNGYYENIFNNPLKKLSELLHPPSTLSTEDRITNEKVKPPATCDRAVLASRIKLFEGIVIQSLKEYTITCNVKLQAQVLRLLTLLVQLKVNYCLLDSDQIFIDFVLKQFEFLEAGQIHDAEFLIPTIFQFLVHLSNEKNHSKPVISVPKIIQLCDGLMASGQNPVTHCIPALLPVVEHVFFKSTNVTDPKDLETQKEVLLVMLLRLAEYPQVLETIHNLLKDGKKDEEHWSKWYKQTMDAIFPLLSEGRLLVTNISSLHSLFCLNKSFVAPLSNVLMLLFTPQQEGQTFTQWLGMVTVCLLSLCKREEDEVLQQLEQMNLYVREEGDDPLKVNTVSKTLPPQSLLAKLLFRITVTSVLKLKTLIQCQLKDENVFELEKAFSSFLLCCAFMFQPENFGKVSNSLSILLSDSADLPSIISAFELIMHRCQIPVLLWAQVMVLLHHSDRSSWYSFMSLTIASESFKPKCSLNQELIRRGTIMLYADYLSTRMKDTKSLHWFLSGYIEQVIWYCHELPVEKLLSIICTMDLNSKILLESISKCINIMEPVHIYRLLHTLEYIHPVYSGAVLKLVALSLIKYKNIAIARLAAAFCSRTIELILTLPNVTTLKEQLTEDELKFIFQSLSSHQKLCKRHSGLISLLNKLGKQCYNISLSDSDDGIKPISPELIKSTKLDKAWFFNIVKEKCCSPLEGDTHRCAYLLSKLESNDLEKIMSSNEFNMNILKHCFSSGFSSSDQVSDEFGSMVPSSSSLHHTAKKILLKLIRDICETLPSSYQVFDPEKTVNHDLFKFLLSEKSMKTFYSLVPAVTNLLFNLKEISVDFGNLFNKDDITSLSRFGVLCIEVVNWILIEEKEKNIKHCPSKLQALLKCSSYVFKTDLLSASLSLEQISSICCALLNIFQFILGEDIVLKEHAPPSNDGNSTEEIPAIAKTAIQMVSMITLIEKNPPNIPWCIFKNARSIIISLGREAKLNWLCRIPIEAWQPPLDCPTPPTLPPMLLHDTDILSQIVSRIRFLGWRGKFQFEESWVCLLGALSPNPDFDNIEQEEIDAMMQANSLAIDGITWLAISALSEHSHSVDDTKYLHVPRHSNEKLYALKHWKRLAKMNDLLCKRLKNISGNDGIYLLRIDERPNLERTNNLKRYGFAQFSVPYLEAQMKYSEEGSVENENDSQNFDTGYRKYLTRYGIDIRSCIQFILDLFPQWILPGIGISLNLQFSMIKSVLCISDMFTERSHFEWMLETFLELAKNQSVQDEIILQYLVIGIAKSCAVLSYFEGEVSDRILKIIDSALKSQSQPLAEAGLHGILYLLQAIKNVEKPVENVETSKLKPQEFRQRVLQSSIEFIQKKFNSELDLNKNVSLLLIALVFYVLECYPEEVTDKQELIKLLIDLAKTTIDNTLYQTILQGFERLVLLGDGTFNEQITRLALNRYSKSDPKVTIPAFQLLLACIYASGNKGSGDENDDNQQMELMEKVTILFDRIKKGYPVEVEIVCDVLPGILADFFSASDILTKVIGEFLSPNQPHKANMAAMVFQVFSQACSEQQLSLLQDWVVYSLGNLTHNIPKMMAAWSLCCFFISASTNPWLKAILPIVQSRMRQCEYEDRQILCLATVDFYKQLNSGQQKNFVQSLQAIGSSQASPFFDLLSCL